MKIAIYTAIFDRYNPLREIPKQSIKADMLSFTDDEHLRACGWKIIKIDYPRYDLHSRLKAKYFKIQQHYIKELQDYDVTIYIDGSILITSPDFVQWCIHNLESDILVFKHPQRQCIFEEIEASKGLQKYADENMADQVAEYKKFYPENNGLYALGVLVRKNNDLVKKIMNDWWNENIRYSYQDQLSFPAVCYMNNFVPSTFQENQYRNNYIHVLWHDDHSKNMITVLMPVFKTPISYLELAVNSILNQSHKEYELLIVDDNNTDEKVVGYLNSLMDHRIKVVRTKENKGLAAALDFGLKHAWNNLIVRMDSDDIARPYLLARHYDFFNNNPHAVCCGVQIQAFQNANWRSNHKKEITKEIAYNSPGYWIANHPGIAYLKDVIFAVGGYGETPRDFAEDYPLWIKLLRNGYLIHNQQELLVNYRVKANYSYPEGYYEHLDSIKKSLINNNI